MNYPANTHYWRPGDLVIHDADAKESRMLMVVLGYDTRTGECITRYVGAKRLWRNDIKYLHNPALFRLDVAVRRSLYDA